MTLAERIASLLVPSTEPQQLRTISDAMEIDEQVLALRRRHSRVRTGWRPASVNEALGVPAILGAVTLISNTAGSLSMEAFRRGVRMEDRPQLIVRPNPFSTPRDFFRDTAYYLATRGEAWWWIAARDIDGAPLSLYPVKPWEITVAENDRNRLRPTITWGNRKIPNEDIRQITYLPSSDGLRGVGPLQLAGAAVSVAVEADEWAANFFSGSLPSVVGTTEQDMSDDELKLMDQQWMEKDSNLPRWLTNGLTLTESPFDPEKAQLTESRQHQVGEAARMFLVPGALIEYQMGGSSLTYQNRSDIWEDFQTRCLSPNYLEGMEQTMGGLLTRSTEARFNLDQLLRGDLKTRAEVYEKMVPIGVMTVDEARQKEGLLPGSVDFAPVPLSSPQATPDRLPINRTAGPIRCSNCNWFWAESASAPYSFRCHRCKTVNTADAPLEMMRTEQAPAPVPLIVPHTEVHNHPPAQPNITFEPGAIQVDAPDPAPAPQVFVYNAPPDMSEIVEVMRTMADRDTVVNVAPAEVTVEPAQVTVEAPNVTVNLPEPKPITRKVKRDKDSNIIEIRDEVSA